MGPHRNAPSRTSVGRNVRKVFVEAALSSNSVTHAISRQPVYRVWKGWDKQAFGKYTRVDAVTFRRELEIAGCNFQNR